MGITRLYNPQIIASADNGYLVSADYEWELNEGDTTSNTVIRTYYGNELTDSWLAGSSSFSWTPIYNQAGSGPADNAGRLRNRAIFALFFGSGPVPPNTAVYLYTGADGRVNSRPSRPSLMTSGDHLYLRIPLPETNRPMYAGGLGFATAGGNLRVVQNINSYNRGGQRGTYNIYFEIRSVFRPETVVTTLTMPIANTGQSHYQQITDGLDSLFFPNTWYFSYAYTDAQNIPTTFLSRRATPDTLNLARHMIDAAATINDFQSFWREATGIDDLELATADIQAGFVDPGFIEETADNVRNRGVAVRNILGDLAARSAAAVFEDLSGKIRISRRDTLGTVSDDTPILTPNQYRMSTEETQAALHPEYLSTAFSFRGWIRQAGRTGNVTIQITEDEAVEELWGSRQIYISDAFILTPTVPKSLAAFNNLIRRSPPLVIQVTVRPSDADAGGIDLWALQPGDPVIVRLTPPEYRDGLTLEHQGFVVNHSWVHPTGGEPRHELTIWSENTQDTLLLWDEGSWDEDSWGE